MPRYRVTERRTFETVFIIDAESAEDAEQGRGEIVLEHDPESWSEALFSTEEIGDDEDE